MNRRPDHPRVRRIAKPLRPSFCSDPPSWTHCHPACKSPGPHPPVAIPHTPIHRAFRQSQSEDSCASALSHLRSPRMPNHHRTPRRTKHLPLQSASSAQPGSWDFASDCPLSRVALTKPVCHRPQRALQRILSPFLHCPEDIAALRPLRESSNPIPHSSPSTKV